MSAELNANSVALTLADVQELADSLHYRMAEGATFGRDYEYQMGLVAGWNSALRYVAEKLGGEITTKSLSERVQTVECPEGHDSWDWTGDDGKVGTYTCVCGHSKRCHKRNARDHHEKHRTDLAWKAECETREERSDA